MKKKQFVFNNEIVQFYFDSKFDYVEEIVTSRIIYITDENIFSCHKNKFQNKDVIILKPGEEYKIQQTVDSIIDQLIKMKADRQTTLIGVGGGVITDITGFAASIYMRGIACAFVPTTILCMVDASIGGKNGVDVGVFKNLVGSIHQPKFILYDYSFLKTLPSIEWISGFAEIIKHAAIRSEKLFSELENQSINIYKKNSKELSKLIQQNVFIKTKIVEKDVLEKLERKLLNFGHSIGHAIENQYELTHGQAISIGMVAACFVSAQLVEFKETERFIKLLKKYQLPVFADFDKRKMIEIMKTDKKKSDEKIHFIMLKKIGKAIMQPINYKSIETLLP
jgi:3-dehydroquinate synthase